MLEVTTILLGLFVGLYASFAGTGGGAALTIYLLRHFKILNSVTMVAGTMLLVNSIPFSLFGLPAYYKHGDINFYVGVLLAVGLICGIIVGSKYAFIVNSSLGKEFGDKIKNGITALIYAVLAVLYTYATIYGKFL